MSYKEPMEEIEQLPPEQKQALLESSWMTLHRMMFTTVFGWTHDEAETEDILQETFLQLFSNSQRSPRNLSNYLLRIARRVYVSRLRRETAGSELDRNSSEGVRRSNQNSPHAEVDQGRLSQRLKGILKFDSEPTDEEVKDTITDYLTEKYS